MQGRVVGPPRGGSPHVHTLPEPFSRTLVPGHPQRCHIIDRGQGAQHQHIFKVSHDPPVQPGLTTAKGNGIKKGFFLKMGRCLSG